MSEQDLYHEFHLDEPWDSPHNKSLIPRMPVIFQTPDSPTSAGMTRFRGFQGPQTMFEANRDVNFSEVTDGGSNTLLIASAREPVVWTQPGELPFTLDLAPAFLSSLLEQSDSATCLVAMADGSVRELPAENSQLLRALITRSQGEVIDWSFDPEPRDAVRLAPPRSDSARVQVPMERAIDQVDASPRPIPSIVDRRLDDAERRLRSIEDKLDRLLEKLNALPDVRKP